MTMNILRRGEREKIEINSEDMQVPVILEVVMTVMMIKMISWVMLKKVTIVMNMELIQLMQ